MQNNHVPDFIGIGAVKAATSWLYQILENHPEVWMPPIKELHYFDRKENSAHLKQILFRRKDFLLSRNRWRSSSKKPTRWNFKYFCRYRDNQYYKDLFSPKHGQICGEITPSYALLEEEVIREIKQISPNSKIIYILRNPIERDWSQLCMTVKNAHKLNVANLSDQEIIDFYERKFYKQSSYVSHINRWESVFNADQIFIGFQDQISNDPHSFLSDLFDFLDISKSAFSFDESLLNMKTNSFSQSLNTNIKQYLVEKEYQNIVAINDKYNNLFTNRWLLEANQFVQSYE